MPTAELVSDLGSAGLPEEDLDEEGVFGVGRDHHLLDVRVCGALVAEGGEGKPHVLYSSNKHHLILTTAQQKHHLILTTAQLNII